MVECNGLVRVWTVNSQQTINTYKVTLLCKWLYRKQSTSGIMNIWRYTQLLYYKLYCSKYNF